MIIEQEIKQTKFSSEMHKAFINLQFTSSWLKNKITTKLKPFGLYPEQFNVLRILRGQSPNAICQKDILSRMIDRSSNLTRIMAKLETQKLVSITRSPKDKREYLIAITPRGLQLLAQLDEEMKIEDNSIFTLSEADAKTLNLILNEMRG